MLLNQIKALTEGIRLELASIHEQIRATRDTEEAYRKASEQIRVNIAELRVKENEKTESRSYRKKNYAIQVALTIGTWGAFIAAGIYAAIAYRQKVTMDNTYSEIRQQTGLLSSQLKGTEAAFVNVVAEVGNQVGNFDRPFNQIYLIVENNGHAIATNVRVRMSIQLVSITGKPMAPAHIFDYHVPALDFKSGTFGDERRFLWDSDAHAAKTLEAIKSLKLTARKEWNFEYGNGFGDTIKSDSFCQQLLINDWVSCENFPIKLRSLNESNPDNH